MTIELKVAAAILFDTTIDVRPDEVDIPRLLMLLKRNKVPIATLNPFKWLDILMNNPIFAEAMKEEQKTYSFMIAEYTGIYETWKKEGIRAVLIKSTGLFPYTSDNVDVLVYPHQSDRAKELLRHHGFVELPHIREPFKDLFRRFNSPERSFAIHVHTAVGWINTFFSAEEILSTCRESLKSPGISYPSAEHCLMINTAHWFYEDKEMKLRDLYNASNCNLQPLDWNFIRNETRRRGWGDGFNVAMMVYAYVGGRVLNTPFVNDKIHEDSYSSLSSLQRRYVDSVRKREGIFPVQLSKPLCKLYHYKKSLLDRSIGNAAKVKDIWLLSRFMVSVKLSLYVRQRAMLVTISGVDYSGKTTLANNIKIMLKQSGVQTRYHWLRIGSSSFLEMLKRPFRRRSIFHQSASLTNDKLSSRVFQGNSVLKNIWALILAGDVVVRMWFFVVYEYMRGGVLIFDRFSHDHFVDLVCDYKIDGVIKAIVTNILRCSPRASIAIWLDGETSEIIGRVQNDKEKKHIEERIAVYKSLYHENQPRYDISLEPMELSREGYKAILQRYFPKANNI